MVFKTASRSLVYKVGEEPRQGDIDGSTKHTREHALAASKLCDGGAAFILRSDKSWSYAIVMEVSHGDGSDSSAYIKFLVRPDGATRKIGKSHWGTRVRTFKNSECSDHEEIENHELKVPRVIETKEDETAECSLFSSINSMDFNRPDVLGSFEAQLQKEENIIQQRSRSKVSQDRTLLGKTPSLIFRNLMATDRRARNAPNHRDSEVTVPASNRADNPDDELPASICTSGKVSKRLRKTRLGNQKMVPSFKNVAPTVQTDNTFRGPIEYGPDSSLASELRPEVPKNSSKPEIEPPNRPGVFRTASDKALKTVRSLVHSVMKRVVEEMEQLDAEELRETKHVLLHDDIRNEILQEIGSEARKLNSRRSKKRVSDTINQRCKDASNRRKSESIPTSGTSDGYSRRVSDAIGVEKEENKFISTGKTRRTSQTCDPATSSFASAFASVMADRKLSESVTPDPNFRHRCERDCANQTNDTKLKPSKIEHVRTSDTISRKTSDSVKCSVSLRTSVKTSNREAVETSFVAVSSGCPVVCPSGQPASTEGQSDAQSRRQSQTRRMSQSENPATSSFATAAAAVVSNRKRRGSMSSCQQYVRRSSRPGGLAGEKGPCSQESEKEVCTPKPSIKHSQTAVDPVGIFRMASANFDKDLKKAVRFQDDDSMRKLFEVESLEESDDENDTHENDAPTQNAYKRFLRRQSLEDAEKVQNMIAEAMK